MSATEPEMQERTRAIRRATLGGLLVNLALTGAKFAVGFLAHSQSLVADAVHSISDALTDLMLLVASRFWSLPADESHPHGHGRLEHIVSLVIGLVMAGAGAGIGYDALQQIHAPPVAAPGIAALWVALASIVVKEWLYRWTVQTGLAQRSPVLIANAWHHRSDALSSIPVAASVVLIHAVPGWKFLDPIAALLVAALILREAVGVALKALKALVDTAATQETRRKLRSIAAETPGVCDIHRLRTRDVGPGLQVDCHATVAPCLSVGEGHDIACAIRDRLLESDTHVVDVLVHIEPALVSETHRDIPRDG